MTHDLFLTKNIGKRKRTKRRDMCVLGKYKEMQLLVYMYTAPSKEEGYNYVLRESHVEKG